MRVAPHCPVTGKPMRRGTRPTVVRYKGRTATIELPGWYCDESGESVHSGEDMKTSDAALKRLRAETENLLPPDEVRRIRKKIGLTQREAGLLIGGGLNAFQKYESGTVTVSKATSNFLRVLERHPEEVAELRKQA